ncbi:50S ribosomal protein L13 [candidate division WWE3 bacterium RIFOXYC1_FULL_39_7]|uniref:Large ribosomal subunit protein uL13 n=2 Tax=Katanobacteria TaxID=422282 RepID=A0A1F4XA38_UNCKA|nr:MAG: 50S ribosomal protein L13 [candidate division WWE3 bacterium RIFOXYC1_FULL_39_7]OGC77933.1 MAG: 50S ribosomal protein L13 [candidate division WWE3 bacterium RIFOXYD1_FULL_39_9]
MQNNTTVPQKHTIKHNWHFIDAKDQTLGRLASRVAKLLIGKNKAIFAYNMTVGDNVVITNAEKITVTGKKLKDKTYQWYTGYPKGLRATTLDKRMDKNPVRVVEDAIIGMLPNNKLRKEMMRKLFVYKGSEHPHASQVKKVTE